MRRFKANRSSKILAAATVAVVSAATAQVNAAAIGYVPYAAGTGTYTQNFDSMAYTAGTAVNSNNPVTFTPNSAVSGAPTVTYTLPNTVAAPSASPSTYSFSNRTLGTDAASNTYALAPGMDGWWGAATVVTGSNATVANRYGAHGGSQTTGGQISFGGLSGSNRSLGELSTSTSGATTTGIAFENTGNTTLTSITLAYQGQLWRQQAVAKSLHFGYLVTPTNVTSNTNGGGALPTSGTTGDSNLDVSFATGTSTGSVDNAAPISTASLGDTISGLNWAPNTTLWLTWQTYSGGTPSAAGGAQGVGFDNLSFTATAVPEPTCLSLLGVGAAALLGRRRRNA